MNKSMENFRNVIRKIILETLQSHTIEPQLGDAVVNVNPGCKHFGSEGTVVDLEQLPDETGTACKYACTNDGDCWTIGDILSKTLDQLEVINIEMRFKE